jgi:hypothetical protein
VGRATIWCDADGVEAAVDRRTPLSCKVSISLGVRGILPADAMFWRELKGTRILLIAWLFVAEDDSDTIEGTETWADIVASWLLILLWEKGACGCCGRGKVQLDDEI